MEYETWVLVLFAGLSGLAALVFLRVLSTKVKQHLEQHETACEAMRLRIQYFGDRQKKQIGQQGGFTILDDE